MNTEVTTKGQISIEYLIIIGVVLLLIVVPSAIFLSSFTQNSVTQTVENDQIDRYGEGIVTAAEQVYYLGTYSQRSVNLRIPRNIIEADIVHIPGDDGQTYYYLRFWIQNGEHYSNRFYQTQVPIVSVQGTEDTNYQDISECTESDPCLGYRLPKKFTDSGQREFLIQHNQGEVGIQVVS